MEENTEHLTKKPRSSLVLIIISILLALSTAGQAVIGEMECFRCSLPFKEGSPVGGKSEQKPQKYRPDDA